MPASIVLVVGLSGSGKTSLAKVIASTVKGVHLNGDEVRKTFSKDLGFEHEDRVTQAKRMGILARMVTDSDVIAVVDFICPTYNTRRAFLNEVVGRKIFPIWMNTIQESRYKDTDKIFVEPSPQEFATQEVFQIFGYMKESEIEAIAKGVVEMLIGEGLQNGRR